MRKLPIALSLMLLPFSTSLFAFASPDSYFYVAADAGIFQAPFNNKYTDQTDEIPQNIAQSVQQYGYTIGAALGYRKLLAQQYFVGAELSGNLDSHTASFQAGAATAAFSDQTQIKNHANLVFVPGIKLSNSIAAYLKLGLSLASIQDNLSSPAGFNPIVMNVNDDKNALGFAAGLEIEKMLTENFSIFIEANYSDYGTVNFSNFQNFSATYSHSTHVYAYDGMLGVSFLFIG